MILNSLQSPQIKWQRDSLDIIPRYLVFNSAGEVANNRAPHPIEQALWEDLLNKLL